MTDRETTFGGPKEVLAFICSCIDDQDPDRFYAAVEQETPEFWRGLSITHKFHD